MTTNQKIRTAVPSLYVVAILIAVFAFPGAAAGAVAAIGAILVGLTYRLTTDPGANPERAQRRRAERRDRRH